MRNVVLKCGSNDAPERSLPDLWQRFFGCFLFFTLVVGAHAEPSDEWKLERIWVRGPADYQGLLLAKNEYAWEFAQLVRPKGKPMYAVIRPIPPKDVLRYEAIETPDRAILAARFDQFRNRALIEAGRMEHLQLDRVVREDEKFLVYHGVWFSMYSTADEATTRRSIVRIEQTFRAFRQILPPKVERASTFQIYLYGSTAEYRAALERYGIEADFPAFFSTQRNAVVAGTDLDRMAREVAKATEHNEQVRRDFKALTLRHEQSLNQVASQMKQNGFQASDVQGEIRRRRGLWKEQEAELERKIHETQMQNAAKFADMTKTMFQRLSHEAFHAYLENYVFPHDQYSVPRWLNEGLAQIFEHAQLDADTLRIDAPSPKLLEHLQAELRSPKPMSLAEFLMSGESRLVDHREETSTKRHYLYAWGLTYYVAFERDSLAKSSFPAYVSHDAAAQSPITRLEKWLDRPIAEIDKTWRAEMLKLK